MFITPPLGRRDLLKGGALIVGFAIAGAPLSAAAATGAAATGGAATGGTTTWGLGKPLSLDEVASFLAITADGTAIIYSGKVDLGTGVETAITQIAAEELDLPLERVSVIQGDTALTPNQGPTWGSLSIQAGGMQIRHAAATARQALVEMAAKKLGAQPHELVIAEGVIRPELGGDGVSYAELVGGKNFSLKLDKTAPTKPPRAYSIVGRPVARLDIPAKVTGQFTYAQDVRVPGMVHGRVVRPSGIGATLESVDASSIQDLPGIIKIVRERNFLGVVAETEWAAIKGAEQLKATWSDWEGLPDESGLWEWVRASKVAKDLVTSDKGDVTGALPEGVQQLHASYDFAIQTHGSIGPSCAVAEIKNGMLTCWTPSQDTHRLRPALAQMLSMPAENVRCIYVEGSGCYGRNGHEDATADAALMARAVGRPVRVQWMRADEHGWDPKGPPTLIDLHAALDASGKITAWQSEFFIPNGDAGTVPLLAAMLGELPYAALTSPGNISRDSAIPYGIANVRTTCRLIDRTPLRPSWIRTPGRMQNTFANESFMDELAAAAGADPLEFRLKYLDDPRGIEVLNRLARLSRWQARPSPAGNSGSGNIAIGRGLSYVHYELVRTYIGAVAEVEVDRNSGKIRAARFFIVHDCGQIINPDGVRNQIEGNVIMTVSRTLMERVTFNRSRVTSLDWNSYPILRFPDVPGVVSELIDRPDQPPWGVGEPTGAVIPAAISNAVFDATGARLRSVPFYPDKVKAALPT
ncbi:MAG: molybdopterin cofactor-binding domain-containing protein [Acetobacteraceae bacterium]